MQTAIDALLQQRKDLEAIGKTVGEVLTSAKAHLDASQAAVDRNKSALSEIDAALKKLGYTPAPPAPAKTEPAAEAKAEPKPADAPKSA
jgi:hypothetical protein